MGNKIQIKEGSELSEKIGQLKMQSSEGGNQTVTICHGLKMLNKNTLLSPHPVRDASLGRTEDTPPKTASRQGCILNRMQWDGVTTFSTERHIPTECNPIARHLQPAKSRRDEMCITVGVAKRNLRTAQYTYEQSPAWGDIIPPLRGLEVGGGVLVRKLRYAPHTVTHDDAPAALNTNNMLKSEEIKLITNN